MKVGHVEPCDRPDQIPFAGIIVGWLKRVCEGTTVRDLFHIEHSDSSSSLTRVCRGIPNASSNSLNKPTSVGTDLEPRRRNAVG